MESPKLTTARRKPPRSDVGLRCIGVVFAFLALIVFMGSVWLAAIYLEMSARPDIALVLARGVGLAALFIFISIGLFRRVSMARWMAVFVSILLMFSMSIVGIVVFMYLIRPELDRVFKRKTFRSGTSG